MDGVYVVVLHESSMDGSAEGSKKERLNVKAATFPMSRPSRWSSCPSSRALVRGQTCLKLLRKLVQLAADANARQIIDVLAALRGAKVDVEWPTVFLTNMRTALGWPGSKGAVCGMVLVNGLLGSRTKHLSK
jgi:hypothetical protein